jgi:hypothetical protein
VIVTTGGAWVDWGAVDSAGVELVLGAGVDDTEVDDVEGVLEVTIVVEVEVDKGGAVVVETVVASVLAEGGVEVEGGGAPVDVGRSSVVLVEFDIVKMRSY